uniref:FtsW/RodA/SpoVE family cell cycle protein n=1 Tax=Agathobacter sp. TaxID=2021311 RepID=UPI0040565DE3
MAANKPKKRRRREKAIAYFDYNLLFIVIFLVCFGLVMLYSSSSYIAANKFGDSTYYLMEQLKKGVLIGSFGMAFFTMADYRIWKKFGFLAYIGSILLCAAVMIPGLGDSSHGSSRWLVLGPIRFQPSEIAKIGVIIFLAMILEQIPKKLKEGKNLLKVFLLLAPIVGVVAYSNLSTAIIILGIAVCMLFVASPKYSHFVVTGLLGVSFVIVFIMLFPYRAKRVDTWLHLEESGDAGFQTLQGLYAIGSGGLFGKGLGESLQKMGNVPESQNDMIFTIICEELGLFGAISVILLFMLLVWRMMVIANNARDLFGSLIVVGVMSHIAIQVILNIAVVTNSIPNTGVILPFFSYGGTSFAFLLCEIGLVLSVSRGIRLEKI